MRYLITFILSLTALTAFSQGAVDRIELGYQTTRRGIVWVRPGLPTHEPAWRISRDTNSIMWHNLTTGIRYDWSYDAGVWYTRDFIASTLPPLDVFTSGAATIDNTQATWINDDGVLHHYSQAEGAWLPDKISFQSAGPTDIAAGVSNGAAVYTTSLWQDSDTYLVYYWDGDSWELLSGSGTNLTYSGTSSPVTLNSSTGTDVTVTAGTGVSLSATSTNMTITNSAPDQTVSITGAGINVVTGTYPNFTITGTEVDGSISNEGSLTVGAGTSTTSIINSNTSGSTGVTLTAGTGLSISETGNVITMTNASPDQTVSLTGAGITNVTGTYPNFTITSTEVDGSTTNELQTLSVSANTTTLSNSGGSMTIAGGGINTVGTAGTTITITGTEVDGSVTNEGVLGVGAGGASSSTIISNTSGATGVTLNAAGILTISESTSSNGGSITITGTEVDGSITNEAQTLSVSGTTSGIISLNAISGSGGGTATIASGTGISVAQSGGTITITNSSPATAGWLIDGNTIAATRRIGSNDNFDVVLETNNTDRLWIDNAGTVSIGAAQLTTAALNINGLQTGTGMLIAGGGSLVGPNFYTATGSGTGSTATVLSGVLSMISGNVEALLKNTATAGTGGGSVLTLNVSPTATSNDPFIKWQTEATTDWSIGIDNDDSDALKLHRFSRPSDNNGVGTIEYGYNGTSIGFSMNKNGVLSGQNFYGIDVLGKIRGDLFVNNIAVANGTVALGSSAGTSPTLDPTVTTWWGNGGRVKFTSGSSGLAANSTLFTITMHPNWKFINNGAPIVYAGSASAAGINTNASYVASTGVITCTLSGTLTPSTSYEFNVSMTGN